MLLEFRAKNYKSFCDEMVFSMVPAQKQKGLDYSILSKKGGSKTYKGLCSSVVYGPNASGKTNIISAMDTFKQIVLRGHIRNEKSSNNIANVSASVLELIPYAFSGDKKPLSMTIKFITKQLLIEYSFSADLGRFAQPLDQRTIISEELHVNDELLFKRTKNSNIYFGILRNFKGYITETSLSHPEIAMELSEGSLNDKELFHFYL